MRPIGIKANKQQRTLTVSWDDRPASTVSFKLLSDACPCELCVNERNNPDPLKILRPRTTDLESINAVGSYAVSIVWRGGCRYGIYRWEYLLQLAELEARAALPNTP